LPVSVAVSDGFEQTDILLLTFFLDAFPGCDPTFGLKGFKSDANRPRLCGVGADALPEAGAGVSVLPQPRPRKANTKPAKAAQAADCTKQVVA